MTGIKKIGKYTLGNEISRGGMGIVYHGMDEDLKRPLAIKMLPKEFFSNREQKERFILEARIIAKLDHPNIMKVYSIEFAEDTVWIVMELLEGKLLSRMILFFEFAGKRPDNRDGCPAAFGFRYRGIVQRNIVETESVRLSGFR